MHHSLTRRIAAFVCAGLVFFAAAAAYRDIAGVKVPAVVNEGGAALQLNGAGVRTEMMFFKVYVAALYLQHPTRNARQAIASDQIKQIRIVMLRGIGRAELTQAVNEGITRNSRAQLPALRARLDKLEQNLQAVKTGDVLSFTYIPGQGTIFRGNGREMTIDGKDFADALLSAWLGRNPVSARLKRQLLNSHKRLIPPLAPT